MKSSLQKIDFGFSTIPFLLVLVFMPVSFASAQCPANTSKNAAGECAITSKLILTEPLVLPSNTTLNCQSHRLEPSALVGTATRRKPAVAIFLNGAQNVKIKNCRIEGFDFGIFAINSKRDPASNIPPIQIFNNDIQARFVGISFISVDYSEIRGNRLGSVTKGGRPIYVGRDSDQNRILNNLITFRVPITDSTAGFRVPGFETTEGLSSNPAVNESSAVLITQAEGPEPSLLNAIIEDTEELLLCGAEKCLFQLTVIDSATPNGLFTEDNVVDGNIITIQPGTLSIDGIALAIPQRTIVSNNRITRARNSIRVGAQTGPPPLGASRRFPGTCSGKPSRFCLSNSDCNIPALDGATGDTCVGATTKPIFWVSQDTIIQDNIITGPFGTVPSPSGPLGGAAITTIGVGTIVTGNIIDGNGGPGVGIRLVGKFGLETTTVTKNSVDDVDIALSFVQLVQVPPAVFSAKISLNDFTRYVTGVKLSRTQQLSDPIVGPFYDLRSSGLLFSELSFDSKGNNWGRRCDQGGFDPNKVRNSDPVPGSPPGSLSAFVKDSHPFGVRVSNTSELTPCQ